MSTSKRRTFVSRQTPPKKLLEVEAIRLLVESKPDITDEEIVENKSLLALAMARQAAEQSTIVEVQSPFCLGEIALPDKHINTENPEWSDHDLLSDELVREFCRVIMEDQVNVDLAGMAVGIPPQTVREYIETGNADLAAGLDTRKAMFAKHANQAVYAVVAETMKQIRKVKMGWQNHSFSLERLFPEFFSDKRVSKKETKVSSQLEALQRQLSGAMTPDERRLGPGSR